MKVFWLDSFCSESFRGNPTPVCIAGVDLNKEQMLSIAMEFNKPVTAFIKERKPGTFSIKYFTPFAEILACGHATLAAAAVVEKVWSLSKAGFVTANNKTIQAQMQEGRISISYPAMTMKEARPSSELLKSMGLISYKTAVVSVDLETLFIEVDSTYVLQGIQPEFDKMLACTDKIKEVVITCFPGDYSYDYLLRSFCPWIGIDEDPVTGSVQAALAPFWGERLGKKSLRAFQASERGGEFVLDVNDGMVMISGECKFFMEGELFF